MSGTLNNPKPIEITILTAGNVYPVMVSCWCCGQAVALSDSRWVASNDVPEGVEANYVTVPRCADAEACEARGAAMELIEPADEDYA